MSAAGLSVILVTPDTWQTMRRTLAALRAQTVQAQIEAVLVGPTLAAIDVPDSEVAGFAAVRRVAVPDMASLGHANAEGIRAATGPLVALTEDHCYPFPDWADAMLRRHAEGDWAAVGPTMINANPGTRTSWSQFIVEYVTHSEAGEKGPQRQLPGHNSCYRREALLAYEPDLAWWLECETVMQWDMVSKGLRLYADPRARTRHWNCSRFGPTFRFAWVFPRAFAAYRATRLSKAGHLKLAVLWPLIPFVRMLRTWPLMTRQLGIRRAVEVLPGVFLSFLVSGAGEGLGYLRGADSGLLRTCLDLEFHRERFLREGEHLHVPGLTSASMDPPTAEIQSANERAV